VDDAVFKRLESYIAQARVILFTGAGFSLGAQNDAGDGLPGVADITKRLWALAFPGEAYDGSSLQDVYEAAAMQARNKTLEALRTAFTVASASLPKYYETWLSLPWYRVYTVNIDDLADAADRAFGLPRRVQSLSALTAPLEAAQDVLQVVHLNGTLEDLPNVTFSGRQYAERLATSDVWYPNLARELVGHPILYLGTTLDEPPLWQYIEARGFRAGGGRELRPGSFLVTRDLPRARQVALRHYKIDWVQGTAESFADDVLSRLGAASERGFGVTRRAAAIDEEVVHHLGDVVQDSQGDEREFLLGREPRWADLTPDGFATARAIDEEIATEVQQKDPRLVVVTGTAGSGKSTSAMRLVLHLREEGKAVVTLNQDADIRAHRIRKAVNDSGADVLYIEDLDRLGQGLVRTLDGIRESRPDLLVVGTIRSSKFDALGVASYIEDRDDAVDVVAPLLTTEDIDRLLDTLNRANRLGTLKGKPRAAQRAIFAGKCDRQLLVAMIEATSGQRFDARIESECRELGADAQLVYAVVAIATVFRIHLETTTLLAAIGGDPGAEMRLIDDLLRTHLFVRSSDRRIQLRHRVIAERAIEYFRSERMAETPLRGLVFALAAAARLGHLRSTPEGRAVIRLINHKFLVGFLRMTNGREPDRVGIRGVYEEVEPLLTQDHHFWLQRGSFETEEGEIDLAKNFIEQATSLAPEDSYVRTQWAYMTMKRASRRPADPGVADQVEEAFSVLDDVIANRGRRDSYPFHVYGSQGLAWANRGGLTRDDKERLLLQLRRVVDEGRKLHKGNRELLQLARDLENEYLTLAV